MTTEPYTIPEQFARAVFERAIQQQRAAELFETLMDGGSATIDYVTGELTIVTGPELAQMVSPPPERGG